MNRKIREWVTRLRNATALPFALLVGIGAGAMIFKDSALSPEPSDSHPLTADNKKSETTWACSMHPHIRQPEPGKCPICGMDLIPIAADDAPPGPRTVVMSERAKTLAQIRTTEVRRQQGTASQLRLLGRIEPNETAERNITAWTGGRIDRLHVKTTGQEVRRSQIIATLYSPEVFSAHQDLLVAKKQVDKMKDSAESAQYAAKRALEASRRRLSLLGVPDGELNTMAQMDSPTTRVAIRTPFGGTVTERVVTEGAYVSTGALLYKIVNLSSVWVQLDAYESDLPFLSIGQQVNMQVDGLAQESFVGEITFINPTLEPTKRIARVRVEVENKERKLRPGMFVQATVKSPEQESAKPPLVIPETAPLFTGHRAIVFVEKPQADRPTYTARTVRLGVKTGNEYPVIAGLSEGERVVTKGAFTLDADLQIRGGDSMMAAPDDSQQQQTEQTLSITAMEQKKIAHVFSAYLEMQKQLAADNFSEAKSAGKALAKAAKMNRISGGKSAVGFWNTYRKHIEMHAEAIATSAGIEDARSGFETLSNQMITVLERIGNPLSTSVRLTFCPMAFGSKGAYWIQSGDVVDNPYYGSAMRTCGEIKNTVDAGTYLMSEMKHTDTEFAPAGEHQH
ncbi:MAG: efflux RND transporter periplasmic adaptor subunit [Deltaproteobacteria bacterium]|nr:efflux RND transporter periplasmic adaptor subunit [Deltaproteobacteria bacterium]MBN2674754.1 efflux RND transporter periplasmic adaptor subunit [Deltaproteobacteria bacterium]